MTFHNLTRQLGSAIAVDGVPSRIELIPVGRFRTADARGEFELRAAAAVIARSLEMAPGGVLLIDFGHGVQGAAERRSDAAGWINALDIEGERVMASVDWTPAGAAAIRDKSYRFLSPVFFNRPDGEVVLITGAGLVNDPALPVLRQLASREGPDMGDLKKVAVALGLSEGASVDDAVAEIEKRGKPEAKADDPALASVLKAAGVETLTEETAQQICARLTTKAENGPDPTEYVSKGAFDDVTRQLASLQKQVTTDAVEKAVAEATAAGKLSPAMAGWARQLASKDMSSFAAFVKDAPVMMTAGREDLRAAETGDDGLTEVERQICSATGVDPEKFAATKKKESK